MPRAFKAGPRRHQPRKRFGQHFLAPAWSAKLLAAIDPRPDETFLEIGPGVAFGLPCQRGQIDIVGQRHLGGVDAENVFAARLVRGADIDQLVEAPRAQQCRIDQRRPVGRTNHHHRLQFLKPVHLGEDGVDHAARHLRFALA